MTKIVLNNLVEEDQELTKLSVREYLENVLAREEFKNSAITAITLDEAVFDSTVFHEVFNQRIQDFAEVKLSLKTNMELAYEATESFYDYISIIKDQISKLAGSYGHGDAKSSNQLFGETIEVIDLFMQLTTKVRTTMATEIEFSGEAMNLFRELELHLLSILKSLVPAKEKEDVVVICDLLEYELVDNLDRWKNEALPILQSNFQQSASA